MHRPWVRLSSVIIMLAVILTSGYRLLNSERQRNVERDAAAAYDSHAWSMSVGLADLRAAQQAYVANGQDPEAWYARVEAQLDSLKTNLAGLRAMSLSSEAVDALGAVDGLVERLLRVDESARDHTSIGQVLMASDLVFNDGQELARQAAEQIEQARLTESQARVQRLGERRSADVFTAAVATIVSVIVGFILLPLPRPGPEQTAPAPASQEADQPGVPAPEPETVSPRNPGEVAVPVPALADLALQPDSTLVLRETTPPHAAIPDLKITAQLCTDLGRVSAGDQLEDVLSRAGDLLNASGLIVWVRDSSGSALRPATWHGYTPQNLSRLGRVACDGDDATALAYRTARLQVVTGQKDGPGAVVVPLMSSAEDPGRCVGVLSAEVRHGWEASDAVQATAAILAAQLATFVTADPLQAAQDQAQAHG